MTIFIKDLSFKYKDAEHFALKDINLDIAPGDFLGIIGPSGAGKTSLASSLSGAIPHHFRGEYRGQAQIGELDTYEASLTDISKVLGSVLQNIDAQIVAANVYDEMLYGLENFGVNHADIPRIIDETLSRVGILELKDREIMTLSGGQKQKVAIAAILALNPQVMVLDEPTAALDPASTENVYEILKTLNQDHNMTIVVIEQKVAHLAEFCKHIAVMSKGELAFYGSPKEVFSHSEELRAIGVDTPRVTRISNSLYEARLSEKNAVALTVSESLTEIDSLLKGASKDSKLSLGDEDLSSPHAHTPKPEEQVLNFEHVDYIYPTGLKALSDVSFDLYAGELLAIVGQNGAGKTTITKLTNGLIKPSAGSVSICGNNTQDARTSQIAQFVSTLFQNPDYQISKNTVLEEVAFSLELLGKSTEEAQSKAIEMINNFGLDKDAAPFTLSRGQRQLVALASTLVTEPRVLILDEPTNGLDYQECMRVMQIVKDAQEQGCAVLMVCHDMEVVSDFASRVIVMANGKMLANGSSEDIFMRDEVLDESYLKAPQVMQVSKALTHKGYKAYHGVSEVSDIVEITRQAMM